MYKQLINTTSFLTLLLTIYTVNQWSTINIGPTFFWWIVFILMTICLIKLRTYSHINNHKDYLIIKIYIFWIIICIIRGMFIAENYWEWKNLITTSFILIMPLFVFISSNEDILSKIIQTWVKFAIPFFFIFFIFILNTEAYGRYFVPLSFLALFFPLLSLKWKFIILSFTFFIIFIDLTARSNVIKAIVPLFFSFLYYFRKFFITKFLKLFHFFLIIMPFIFFILVLTGGFNIFKMNEYIDGEYESSTIVEDGSQENESLTTDTRTFLYVEVLQSALKNNYLVFGRTPARGNDSVMFGDQVESETNSKKYERHSNEVAVLNIFTWTGLIGLLLYYLIFIKASYLAVYSSNNVFIKILGTYVAFRWCFAWVEDFSKFDLTNIFLWIAIGMCFSEHFRSMDNFMFKNTVRNIFKK